MGKTTHFQNTLRDPPRVKHIIHFAGDTVLLAATLLACGAARARPS